MSQSPTTYQLNPEIKIRREAFGGILYKYGCADRGALSFINSPQLIELLITAQQQYNGDLSATIENRAYSQAGKHKLYTVLDDLARRGYIQIIPKARTTGTCQ
jgi:putative mycofactocin binding protein MftB